METTPETPAWLPMLGAICLELTTFARHQQRLSDNLQISEAENILVSLELDCSVFVWMTSTHFRQSLRSYDLRRFANQFFTVVITSEHVVKTVSRCPPYVELNPSKTATIPPNFQPATLLGKYH